MKYINVLYDYLLDESGNVIDANNADILLVPNYVCENIDEIVQEFFDWVDTEVVNSPKETYPGYWVTLSDGDKCLGVNSDHFVDWINKRYFFCEKKEALVSKVNTIYNPQYPSAKF